MIAIVAAVRTKPRSGSQNSESQALLGSFASGKRSDENPWSNQSFAAKYSIVTSALWPQFLTLWAISGITEKYRKHNRVIHTPAISLWTNL